MKVTIFEFDHYKALLKEIIHTADKKYGMTSKLAGAAACQRSYLSQVLNGDIHLTPDHCYGIAQFLRYNEIETDYFLLLVEKERASSVIFKNRIEAKLKKIKRDQQDLTKVIQAKVIDISDPMTRYYSSWYWMAIHLLTSIPEYQSSQSIANRLELSKQIVEMTLQELLKMDLVEKKEHRWLYKGENLHLSIQSPSVILHHNNWRQKALLDASSFNNESVHYTSLVTLSRRDVDFLKVKVHNWIVESRKIIEPSESEDMICMNIDYFRV